MVVSPNIITHPANTSAAAPFSGMFMCSINGHGYQNITWFRQSDTLPTKHNVSKTMSRGVITSTLIIFNVTETDVGKYYCQVWTNNRGIKSKTAILYYSGKQLINNFKMSRDQSSVSATKINVRKSKNILILR